MNECMHACMNFERSTGANQKKMKRSVHDASKEIKFDDCSQECLFIIIFFCFFFLFRANHFGSGLISMGALKERSFEEDQGARNLKCLGIMCKNRAEWVVAMQVG